MKSYVCAKSNSGNDGNARHWASLDFVDPFRLYINVDFCDFPCFLLLSLLSCRLFPFFGLSPLSCFRLLALLPFPCFLLLSLLSCLRFPCLSLLLLSGYLIISVFPYPFFLCLFLRSRFLAVSFFACPAFCFVVSFSSFSLFSAVLLPFPCCLFPCVLLFFLLLNTIVQSTLPAPGRSGLPNLPSFLWFLMTFLKQSTCYSETRLCKARRPHPGEVVYLTYLIFLWFFMIVLSILRFRCFLLSCLFPYQCCDGPFPFSSSRAAFASPSAVWLNSL